MSKNKGVETIGDRIKRARENRGWSRTTLEKKSGVKKGAIGAVERNERLPRIDKALAICETFDRSLYWLIYGQDEPKTDQQSTTQLEREINAIKKMYTELGASPERILAALDKFLSGPRNQGRELFDSAPASYELQEPAPKHPWKEDDETEKPGRAASG